MPITPFPMWVMSQPETLEIKGRLDNASAPDAITDASQKIQTGTRELLLDCRAVDAMTAAGMRAFLAIAREMQAVGGKIAVCNLQPQVKEMFEACGFEQVIPAFNSQENANSIIAA